MGILKHGTVLTWEETKARAEIIKQLGIEQFLKLWDAEATRHDEEQKWGDEIEYMLVHFDHEKKNATLAVCQEEILERLRSSLSNLSPVARFSRPAFETEFAKYQIETTPGTPYTSKLSDLLSVEHNMRQRRTMIRQHLGPNESPITLSSFPRLGATGVFTHPSLSASENVPDESQAILEKLTSSQNRYETIQANMTAKKGSKMLAQVPIFVDKYTANPSFGPTHLVDKTREENCEGRIFLDSMVFGAGCCCMQVTQQLENLDQARKIYDALLPMAPLLMALSASSPAWRGYLCDTDCRWSVATSCLDDRTHKEYQENQRPRWDISGMYISLDEENKPQYNDVVIPFDKGGYEKLKESGIDELLAKHVASLFAREPLIAYTDDFDNETPQDTNHFDNINTSVWQALRLKPPQGPKMGWRIEFRTTEASITDFETAAFAIFIIVLSRAILHFNLNFYIPISKVMDNMHVAQHRNAATQELFSFRKVIYKSAHEGRASSEQESVIFEDMSIDEIFNGSEKFAGLLIFVDRYIEAQNPDKETRDNLLKYINYIRGKAKGTYMTTAAWMRNFVCTHPKYQADSIISEEICYDLMVAVDEISREQKQEPGLLPN